VLGFDAPLTIETVANFDCPKASGTRIMAEDIITRASTITLEVKKCLAELDFFNI
jgi:hypothetical protein